MKRSRAALLLVLTLLPATVRAQEISVRVDDHSRAADVARRILARGRYLRLTRDTVLPPSFRTPGDVVVIGPAEVKLEGSIDGEVAVLGGQLYLRPGARVGGRIAVLGGGVYRSAKATYGEIIESSPSTTAAVTPDTTGGDTLDVAVVGLSRRPRLGALPRPTLTYDRVNGLSATVTAVALLQGIERGRTATAWAGVRRWQRPVAGLRLEVPFAREFRALGEVSRGWRTNDAWARGDLANSVGALVSGSDVRDYYDTDRASLTLLRPYRRPIISPESWFGPRVGVLWERARSLERSEPRSLFGEGLRRPNPPVDDGAIVSALVGADLRKRWPSSRIDADLQVERGLRSAGDFGFTQLTAATSYSAIALRTHTMMLRARVVAPLGGEGAPRQRYGILGGGPTLPTEPIGSVRGDHVVYLESSYAVPLPRLVLPYVGSPAVELWYAAGTAWVTGAERPPWVQNLGLGLQFRLARARLVVDPAASDLRPHLVLGVGTPQR